ncbi:hypothetical protein G7Y89_g9859 [Cudoniella acicularis]|uniref:Major facilitator superfamily (MFS) profile domain-containing protein n=1 Tax=Cudoniella acicularis TaxID=354080 RepID=A0A8H4RDV5_9HELO|nr:hypothetical protein G7Y89_g9859 [Cudoniella acicularis]
MEKDTYKNTEAKLESCEDEVIAARIGNPPERTSHEKALVWKQDLRIVPLCAAIYLLCYLDRSNIGNAKTLNASTHNDLLSTTHMTDYQYVIALMIFLIAYAIFEVPSNYLLKKLSPSKWIAFLMFAWGAVTMGLGGTQSFASVTAVRFILGMFEAGLFPGLVYYLTFWYRIDERSIRVAFILASATLAGAFGGAIAYGVGHMNMVSGLSAWRWLFILEGIPSLISSVFVFFFLPDYPESVKWLSADEKALAIGRLEFEASHGDDESLTWAQAKETLTDWRLYVHYAIYFGISTPFSSLSLFTPSITAGLGYENLQAQLMTVPPYAVAYHFNARGLHSAVMATIGAIGFLASAVLPAHAYHSRYGCLIVAASGAFSCIPPLLGWLSSNLHTTGAVGLAIAINISIGAPGQIAGVWIYKADEAEIGYPTGHWTNAALLFFVGDDQLQAYEVATKGRMPTNEEEYKELSRQMDDLGLKGAYNPINLFPGSPYTPSLNPTPYEIVERYSEVLEKRWVKKTRKKQKDLLLQFSPGDGVKVFELQEKIYPFLIKCCELILHDLVESGSLFDEQFPIVSETAAAMESPSAVTEILPSLASISAEAPYRLPADLDLEHLRGILATRLSAAEDHLVINLLLCNTLNSIFQWAFREDPGCFADTIIDWSEHRNDRLLDTLGNPYPTGPHTTEFWERVIRNAIADAYSGFETCSLLHRNINRLCELKKKYEKKTSYDQQLPEEYLIAILKFK